MGADYFEHLKKLVRWEEAAEAERIRSEWLERKSSERESAGTALLGMCLKERLYGPGGHLLARFEKRDSSPLPWFTFECGDSVTLVPKSKKLDEYPQGIVYDKDETTLEVALRETRSLEIEEGEFYDLERSTNRFTYRRMLETLEAVRDSQAEQVSRYRRILIADDKPRKPDSDRDPQDFFDKGLNVSQKEAVRKSLRARDVALIQGPPGTGKTRVLVEVIRQHAALNQSIFATAPSNAACDHLLSRLLAAGLNALRLGHPARIHEDLREHTLDFRLMRHELSDEIREHERELLRLIKRKHRYEERRSPSYGEERQLTDDIFEIRRQIRLLAKERLKKLMREIQVFVGTPVAASDRVLEGEEFDLLVFDEATQATQPLSWIPMIQAHKTVMAGDQCQLPPTVLSPEADEGGLGISLFERAFDRLGEDFKHLIHIQYRMNETIMGFSSKRFYADALQADESVRTHVLAQLSGVEEAELTRKPMLFLDTAGKGFEEILEEGSQSRYNPEEAKLTLSVVERLLNLGVPVQDIAVISPYGAQVRYLTRLLNRPELAIDSVDAFQGQEKECIVLTLVRSNLGGELGFLNDVRRMNVAMTRARRKLIVIGDGATLASLPFYSDLIEYAQSHGAYQSVWEFQN